MEKPPEFNQEEIKTEKETVRFWKLISEEPAWLRLLNAEDVEDLERYKQIDRGESQQWMIGEEMTEEKIKDVINLHSKDRLLYAISGEKSEGELEGWVQLLPEEGERIERIRKEALADLPQANIILELSYARYKNQNLTKERQEKGLISSGVRQICYSLGLELNEEDEETKKSKKPLLKPKLSIVGYTDPTNVASERVLESASFKKSGEIQYEADSEKNDNFWMLDWDKLSAIYAKKDEERMMKK